MAQAPLPPAPIAENGSAHFLRGFWESEAGHLVKYEFKITPLAAEDPKQLSAGKQCYACTCGSAGAGVEGLRGPLGHPPPLGVGVPD